jgi:superfamily II DNA/RNA helicase
LKAETGSGKTLAYLVPLMQKLLDIGEKEHKIERHLGIHGKFHSCFLLMKLIID